MRFSSRILTSTAAIALVLSACGGSDAATDSVPADTADTVVTTDDDLFDESGTATSDVEADDDTVSDTAADVPTSTDAPVSTDLPVSTDAPQSTDAPVVTNDVSVNTDVTASGTVGSLDGNLCERMQSLKDAIDRRVDPDDVEGEAEVFGDFALALEAIAEIAPRDVAADAELLAEAFRVISGLSADDEPTPAQLEILDSEEYDLAGERFEEFAMSECDIELG